VNNARVRPPRVTVLTTVYNGARYLDEAIDSILAEEFTDFEYIIVDDGSTDETPAILARATSRDPRILVLRNETNRGIAASANRGLAVARGEYIARLDADDISMPGRFTREVAVLDAHPEVALVSMNYESISADGVVLSRSHRDHPSIVVEYLLHFSNSLGGHSQVMFRRSAVEAVGGYDQACAAALDSDLWTRIVRHGRIVVLPEIGMRYRVHEESVTARAGDMQVHVGKRVLQRTLSAYLGRSLTDHEVLALIHAWRPLPTSIDPKLANAILHEAYRIFRGREARNDPRARRIVRAVTAKRLTNTAVLLMTKGKVVHSLQHLTQALRWNPLVTIARIGRVAWSVLQKRMSR
jgi:glycosyltransferase involved in cell wall biosynthesis